MARDSQRRNALLNTYYAKKKTALQKERPMDPTVCRDAAEARRHHHDVVRDVSSAMTQITAMAAPSSAEEDDTVRKLNAKINSLLRDEARWRARVAQLNGPARGHRGHSASTSGGTVKATFFGAARMLPEAKTVRNQAVEEKQAAEPLVGANRPRPVNGAEGGGVDLASNRAQLKDLLAQLNADDAPHKDGSAGPADLTGDGGATDEDDGGGDGSDLTQSDEKSDDEDDDAVSALGVRDITATEGSRTPGRQEGADASSLWGLPADYFSPLANRSPCVAVSDSVTSWCRVDSDDVTRQPLRAYHDAFLVAGSFAELIPQKTVEGWLLAARKERLRRRMLGGGTRADASA